MSAARRRCGGGAVILAIAIAGGGSVRAAEDIRDIRLPAPSVPGWLWPGLAAGTAAVAGALYLGWRAWRRRRARSPAPLDRALAELSAARALMHAAGARQFAVTVSGIVRRYLEQRYALRVSPRTSEEFLREIVLAPEHVLAPHRARLTAFLEQCDLAKYSGAPLTQPNLEAIHQSAAEFLRATAEEPHAALSAA
jgi:hypothetical protein